MNKWLAIPGLVLAVAAHGADPSPYAGEEHREIKSLSAAEIQALRRGDGMGFAKAAELNRYPGPRHVLELAEQLALSASQRQRTEQLFTAMQADAVAIGEQLIDAEAALEKLFAAGTISAAALETQLALIGELQARLRFVHLDAHLKQTALLEPRQVARYVKLRGYHGGHSEHH